MRTKAFFAAAAVFALILAGCGGDGGHGVPNPPIPFWLDSIDSKQFPPPLVSSDFNAPSRTSRSFDFFRTDFSNFVPVDVTSLLQDAQNGLLPDFMVRFRFDQARFQADLATIQGSIVIDDPTTMDTRPLLHVEYIPFGGGPVVPLDIFSDRSVDGDISQDLATLVIGPPSFASVTGNVLAGISFDATGVPITETRGFLIFPLGTLPVNATVTSAFVEVFLLDVVI